MNEFEVQVRSFDILSMHMVYRLDTILPTYHETCYDTYLLIVISGIFVRPAKVIYSQMMWMCTRHGNGNVRKARQHKYMDHPSEVII